MIQLLLPVIYISFISLGLPDSLLGSAWPSMYQQFQVPVSYAGIIFMIISAGTVVSSLNSDRLTKKLGPGKITMLSVATTALALFGFSISHSFLALCLWAIPYGLGAGSVDAALNNYVALHYESHHMSWLHCMWGVGASSGPYIMSMALTSGCEWNIGYRIISIIQIVLTFVLLISLPLWKRREEIRVSSSSEDGTNVTVSSTDGAGDKVLSLKEIVRLPGAKAVMIAFFCYCALEQTAGLWASSYMVLHHGIDATTAAKYASLFFLGLTIGRGVNGFIAMKLRDSQMIRLGFGIILVGIIIMLVPARNSLITVAGLVIAGVGCAPIYPCIIHSTPDHFGADKSQAIVGVQMASAYVGSSLMPPLFGLIANHISVKLYPVYLIIILVVMIVMYEKLVKETKKN